jgi:hypothetical protein
MEYALLSETPVKLKTQPEMLKFYKEALFPSFQDGILSLVWDDPSDPMIGYVTECSHIEARDWISEKYRFTVMVPSQFPVTERSSFTTKIYEFARPISMREATKLVKRAHKRSNSNSFILMYSWLSFSSLLMFPLMSLHSFLLPGNDLLSGIAKVGLSILVSGCFGAAVTSPIARKLP